MRQGWSIRAVFSSQEGSVARINHRVCIDGNVNRLGFVADTISGEVKQVPRRGRCYVSFAGDYGAVTREASRKRTRHTGQGRRLLHWFIRFLVY